MKKSIDQFQVDLVLIHCHLETMKDRVKADTALNGIPGIVFKIGALRSLCNSPIADENEVLYFFVTALLQFSLALWNN